MSVEKSIKLDNEGITGDTELHSLHHLTPAKSRELNNQIRAASDVFVYGVQGKSRNIGLWSLQSLLASNANLEEVDPRREIETGQFIIPQEGIQRALCNRVVILHDWVALLQYMYLYKYQYWYSRNTSQWEYFFFREDVSSHEDSHVLFYKAIK